MLKYLVNSLLPFFSSFQGDEALSTSLQSVQKRSVQSLVDLNLIRNSLKHGGNPFCILNFDTAVKQAQLPINVMNIEELVVLSSG